MHNFIYKHRLQDRQWIEYETTRSGITEADYHNGIPYEEAIVEVKSIMHYNQALLEFEMNTISAIFRVTKQRKCV